MAKAKTTTPKPRHTAAVVSTPDSRSKLRTTVRDLLTTLPGITDAARTVFRARYDDAYCATLGSRTRGDRVAAEGVTWLVTIAAAVTAQPQVLAAYGPPRVRWLAECVDTLLQALDTQDAAQGTSADNHSASAEARNRALDARDVLLTRMEAMAGRHGKDSAAVAGARGTTGTYNALIESLGALADVATAWLGRTDEGSRTLAAASGLTQSDVDEAHAAIAAMDAAGATATAAGHAHPNDLPAVNIAEGRVLAELLTARTVFDGARARVPTVPALVPGAGTRTILARSRGHLPKAPAAPAPTPGGGSPATAAPVPAAGPAATDQGPAHPGVNPQGPAPLTPAQQAAYQGPAPLTPGQPAYQGPAPQTSTTVATPPKRTRTKKPVARAGRPPPRRRATAAPKPATPARPKKSTKSKG